MRKQYHLQPIMKDLNTQEMQPPPSLLAALRGGFNAITNHIGLISFPMVLDLLLWMGPQVRLTQLVQSIVDQMAELYAQADMEAAELLAAGEEMWSLLAESFNLAIGLRTYPLGVFSLMSSRLPVETPLGEPMVWEVDSLGGVMLGWLLISLLGLAAAALYFKVVAQAALNDQVNIAEAIYQWRWIFVQFLILTVISFVFIILVGIPGSIMLSLMVFTQSPLILCVLVLTLGFFFVVLIPLLFTPHGIVASEKYIFEAVKSSVRIVRMTLPATSMFFLAAVVLSEGLDILWRVPAEDSWLTLVGIIGHAFITTGLLAASFIFYRDAKNWVDSVYQKMGSNSLETGIKT
jgi:hypothetical protein